MTPNLKDLVMYVNKALDSVAWNTNFQKIVNWLTSGNYDIKVKNLEVSEGGGITNNGSLTQSGNLAVTGDVSATGNLTVGGVISGDGSGLTGVVSSAQVSYTPFCVNSGNLDSDGKGDLFDYTEDVSTSIAFKVDDGTSYKPITFTNAKGKTITLNAINSYDLSQTDNGTYIVYLEDNATAVTLTDNNRNLFRQPYAPTVAQDPQPSDIWLDTSTEGLKSYIRQSGTWVEADITPLGVVVINNHKVQSAKTFEYNSNSYDLNNTYDGRLNIATAIAPDISTETNVLNTNTQYADRALWLRIVTQGQDMGGTVVNITAGKTSSALNNTIWKQQYEGANIKLTSWIFIPAKTYYKLNTISYVESLSKYEIMGYSLEFYKRLN